MFSYTTNYEDDINKTNCQERFREGDSHPRIQYPLPANDGSVDQRCKGL